jgi:uncharacterized spore protein YtfJ
MNNFEFKLNTKYRLRGGGWGMPVYVFPDAMLLVVTDDLDYYTVCDTGRLYSVETRSARDLLPELYVEPPKERKLYAYKNDDWQIVYLLEDSIAEVIGTNNRMLVTRAPEYDLTFPGEKK